LLGEQERLSNPTQECVFLVDYTKTSLNFLKGNITRYSIAFFLAEYLFKSVFLMQPLVVFITQFCLVHLTSAETFPLHSFANVYGFF
jgi:hypothetical protein